MKEFEALVLSLPARNSTLRMRAWRALKEAGCGVLRDGLYVLPASRPDDGALQRVESEIRSSGGFAMRLELRPKSAEQLAEIERLFDRSAEHGALLRKIEATKPLLARLGPRRAHTAIRRLQRAFDKLSQIDFFAGEAKVQAAAALSALEQRYREAYAGGEPRASQRKLRQRNAGRYRKRIWATRSRPWVDRLASAWLIKRFIDREARFAWFGRPSERPKGAVGFDFDGAEFTHVKSRVTFEILAASFGLDDAQLERIDALVAVPERSGLVLGFVRMVVGQLRLRAALAAFARGFQGVPRPLYRDFERAKGGALIVRRGTVVLGMSGSLPRDAYLSLARLLLPRL